MTLHGFASCGVIDGFISCFNSAMNVGHHISSNLKSLRMLSLILFKLECKRCSLEDRVSHCLQFVTLLLKAADLLDLASLLQKVC